MKPHLRLSLLVAAAVPLAAAEAAAQVAPPSSNLPRTIQTRDLVIESVRLESPLGSTACVGSSNRLTVRILNTGIAITGNFYVAYGPINPEGADLFRADSVLVVNGIGRNERKEVVFRSLTGTTTGGGALAAEVNHRRTAIESNYGNNLGSPLFKLGGLSRFSMCPRSRYF